MQQLPYVTTAFAILDDYFRERPDVFVGGEGYLCRDTRDRSGWVVPDCVVAFGVDPGAIMDRNGYVIDEVGKPPDFVLEIASESTGRADYTAKRDIYAGYGVREYWRFDSTGGQYHDAALSGERLVGGVYETLPLQHGQDGVVRGHSPVLGLELHWDDGRLRFYDPASLDYLPGFAEVKERLDSAIRERDSAIYERDSAVYERDSADRRADRAESELQRLRDQIRRLQSE
jgi:Uma2 family endonuclease